MTIDSCIVLDCETTGLSPAEGAQLLEVAHVCLERGGDGWYLGEAQDYLVAYDAAVHGPVPAEARAVHHISEIMVAPEAPGVQARDAVLHGMLAAEEPGQMAYAAHNAAYDRQFLPELGRGCGEPDSVVPWICTYRCALHLYPDAPRHGNQVLRYFLNAEPPVELLSGLAPHRALYDAAVTAAVLRHMLRDHSPEELVRLTGEPVLLTTCRFGKHAGQLWSEVPTSYLWWLRRSSDTYREDGDVRHTVDHYLG